MGERLLCKQEVIGSIPLTSILLRARRALRRMPSEARSAKEGSPQEAKRKCVAGSAFPFGLSARMKHRSLTIWKKQSASNLY